MKLRSVKGTRDVLPEDQPAWRNVLDSAQRVLGNAGALALGLPMFEYAEVFERSVGESSDIVVQKEMYLFEDRGGRQLALRPEFTAGVLRSFAEHGMHTRPLPVKLWTSGPAFRAENVQRGRFRQFSQVNYEVIGSDSPLADAEAVQLMHAVLTECGLGRHVMMVGSVGDPADRAAYNDYLRAELSESFDRLSATSRERLRLNPMRVLDSKDAGDQELLAGLDRPLTRMGPAATEHFEQVLSYLREWGVPHEVDPGIVRGLDYYRRTAFEAHHRGIGAQSALGGGGRYDGLLSQLGGPDLPGMGWAFGIERVIDALAEEGRAASEDDDRPKLFLVPLDDEAVAEAAALATRLRAEGAVEFAYQRRAPGKGLADADRRGATHAALRGESERAARAWQLKDLRTGQQREVSEDDLASLLQFPA